jgi:Predicted ATPases of PP-loop superfamily
MKDVLLFWSSGKDSAWALHLLAARQDLRVAGLVTTFDQAAGRVAMHSVRRSLVEAQAERTGMPLWQVELPWPCPNAQYEQILGGVFQRAADRGITGVAFGDLFLRDIRDYRERQLEGTGLAALFPLWDMPTGHLALDMIGGGIRAKVTCVNPARLDPSFAGRDFDLAFLRSLPAGVDPCGENGEFHTFVYDAPVFHRPIDVQVGAIEERSGFVFADLLGPGEAAIA